MRLRCGPAPANECRQYQWIAQIDTLKQDWIAHVHHSALMDLYRPRSRASDASSFSRCSKTRSKETDSTFMEPQHFDQAIQIF
jgi:hypothetical protein